MLQLDRPHGQKAHALGSLPQIGDIVSVVYPHKDALYGAVIHPRIYQYFVDDGRYIVIQLNICTVCTWLFLLYNDLVLYGGSRSYGMKN